MKKRLRIGAWGITYIVVALVLAILVILALNYVDSVLDEYENEHPTKHLERAIELLKKEAADGTLWTKDNAPAMIAGKFEPGTDPKADFIKKLNGDIEFTAQKWVNETDCVYGVTLDGTRIADITLKKVGEPVTKLAIISIQEYELVSYLPTTHSYSISLPEDVTLGDDIDITVNGISLSKEDGKLDETKKTVFYISDLYSKPQITISDKSGNTAKAKIPESDENEITFDSTFYTLTLPEEITVKLDGASLAGTPTDDGRHSYRIRLAKKAKVELFDMYGNTVEYTGSADIPLTCYMLMTSDGCKITVDGKDIPESAMQISPNPEYKNFADLVPALPRLPVYTLIILKDNAEVVVTDSEGERIELEKDVVVQDLTGASAPTPLDSIPAEVAAKVDVLQVLKDWSLFMSCDLEFAPLSKHLIYNSYQYKIAYKYNYSIDRTFTSWHSLKNPAFTEEEVKNFTWLTDSCFSVDIRFVKHMLVSGLDIDDEMNERCYFAKDSYGNWKLVGMKEVIEDAK